MTSTRRRLEDDVGEDDNFVISSSHPLARPIGWYNKSSCSSPKNITGATQEYKSISFLAHRKQEKPKTTAVSSLLWSGDKNFDKMKKHPKPNLMPQRFRDSIDKMEATRKGCKSASSSVFITATAQQSEEDLSNEEDEINSHFSDENQVSTESHDPPVRLRQSTLSSDHPPSSRQKRKAKNSASKQNSSSHRPTKLQHCSDSSAGEVQAKLSRWFSPKPQPTRVG